MASRDSRDLKKELPTAVVEGWLNVLDVRFSKDLSLLTTATTNDHTPSWQPRYCVLYVGTRKFCSYCNEKEADDCRKFQVGKSFKIGGNYQEFIAAEEIRETAAKQWKKASQEMHSHNQDKKHDGNAGFEKPSVDVCEVRRGSVPTVISCVSSPDDQSLDNMSMSTSATPSRIMNFLSRKSSQFKDNLKRTKSTTKLDRKKPAIDAAGDRLISEFGGTYDNGLKHSTTGSSGVGRSTEATTATKDHSLKRVRSLSRLSHRWGRNKPRIATVDDVSNAEETAVQPSRSRITTARSHESLLTPTVTAVDMAGVLPSDHRQDVNIGCVNVMPIHSAVFSRQHCFQVSTSAGSTFYSCQTDGQRHDWINSLQRQIIDPQRDLVERTENQLKLSISEAKNLSPKYRYFCEICLDKTLYTRTTSQQNSDMLFWGQQFELFSLPAVEKITVNIHREAEKRKKKDSAVFIGHVDIPTSEVCGRQPTERWYPVQTLSSPATSSSSSVKGSQHAAGASDLPSIRIKAHYQAIHIRPLTCYRPLIEFLQVNNRQIVQLLEPETSIRTKEDLATLLVSVLQKVGYAKEFLVQIVTDDINKGQGNHQVMFRANSIATKAVEAYMKLVGNKYLHKTLGEFVRSVIESPDSLEVDPAVGGSSSSSELQRRRNRLIGQCESVWYKINNSVKDVPVELKGVFSSLRDQCSKSFADSSIGKQLVSSCVFLRFLCPAVLSPSLFGLSQTVPPQRAMRNLTLIAKTLQGLANFNRFGAKEEYMMFMNQFVDEHIPNMKQFIDDISTETSSDQGSPLFDDVIDLGKEISQLHALLAECLDKLSNKAQSAELEQLRVIIANISNPNSHHQEEVNPSVAVVSNSSVSVSDNSMDYSTCDDVPPPPANGGSVDSGGDGGGGQMDIVPSVTRQSKSDAAPPNLSFGAQGHQHTCSNNNNARNGRARMTMREIQDSEMYTSFTSAKTLAVAAPPVRHRPPTPIDETGSRNLAPMIYAAETVIDGGHAVEELADVGAQWSSTDAEPISPRSPDVTMGSPRPLAFNNPLFLMKAATRPPVAPINGGVAAAAAAVNNSENSRNPGHVFGISRTESTPSIKNIQQLYSAPTAANGHATNSGGLSPEIAATASPPLFSTSNECLTAANGSDVEISVDRNRRSCQMRIGRVPSPLSGSTTEQHFFGSNVALSRSSDLSGEHIGGSGTPLRRSLASSTVGLDTPPESPHCVGGCHGVGPSRKNSSSQNSVRMGVRSVQRKAQEQEKSKLEYELELNATRQQLQSLQSLLDKRNAQLDSEREANEQLSAELKRLLHEASDVRRVQEAGAEISRLKQQLTKTEQDLRQCRQSLADAQRTVDGQRREIQLLESANSRLNSSQRSQYASEWKPLNSHR